MSFRYAKRESDGYRFACEVECDICGRRANLRDSIQDPDYIKQYPSGFYVALWRVDDCRVTEKTLCAGCVDGTFSVL